LYFPLTETEIAIRNTARQFADKELRPGAAEREAAGVFPYELYRSCGELGFTGAPFPEEYGGVGASWLSFVLAVEEFCRVDSAFATSIMVTADVAHLLNQLGTEEQKRRWMEPLVRGTHIAAFGLTEPDCGSDTQSMRTKAELVGGEWVLNGSKAFITNSGTDITLCVVVFCVSGERPDGRKEFSCILVPSGTPGLTVSPAEHKIGWKSSDTHELLFDDCRVPESNLVGVRGSGLREALAKLGIGRVIVAAAALGLAQGCLDECIRYANDRSAFGAPIGTFQAIRHKIAEMATQVTASRLMVYQVVRAFEAGQMTPKDASMVKLFVAETAQRAAVDACDIFGGMGFMEEVPVARFYRDAKALTIVEGTSNIQKMVIARQLGLP